jgi:hypothetical protein
MSTPVTAASASRARALPKTPQITPFWNRLNAFFLFPFQPGPLLYAGFLSLCSFAVILPGLIGLATIVGILLATARYSFKVAAMASMGLLKAADFSDARTDPDWTHLPWKFLGVLMVHGLVVSALTTANERLGHLASLLSSLLIPATLMVLIQTCRLRSALNPAELLRAVSAVGLPYLLLCLFMMLLSIGMPMAWSLLLPLAPEALIAPLMTFVAVYFAWVSASMLGYAMYQNHERLDIDVVRDPQAAAAGAHRPGAGDDPLARARDTEVSDLIRQGDPKAACELAYEWQRANPESLADMRRYHRVLLLTDKVDSLTWFTERFLQTLLREHKQQEALKAHLATLAKLPDLVLESADLTLTLAQLAWKGLDDKHALSLLKAFDKRYPNHPAIPSAYELIARVLHQGLGRTAQALTVLRTLQSRYPQHPATQEAAWMLREQVAPATAAGA